MEGRPRLWVSWFPLNLVVRRARSARCYDNTEIKCTCPKRKKAAEELALKKLQEQKSDHSDSDFEAYWGWRPGTQNGRTMMTKK